MRALREAEQAARARVAPRAHRLPRHVGVRGRGAARLAATDAPARSSSSPAPTARRAAAASSRRRRSPTPRASSASSVFQPDERQRRPRRCARIAAAEPEVVAVCAFGALIKEPLLVRPRAASTSTRRCCRAGAARRPSSGRSWPATPRPASDHALTEAGFDTRPGLPRRRASRSAPDDTYGTLAPRLEQLGADLLSARSTSARAASQQPEEGVTYAEKIGPDDRTLDPARAGAPSSSASCAR